MTTSAPAPLYDDSFQRLAKLQGGDPGFFVLAAHSFVEGVLRSSFILDDPADDHFSSYINEFRDRLVKNAARFIPGLDVLNLIKQQHQITNDVRHRFSPATVEDARAATQHLKRFCALAGIPDGDGFRSVLEYLKAWDDRRSYPELVKEINDLGYRFQLERSSSKEMTKRITDLEALKVEALHLTEQIQARDRRIAELEVTKDAKDARVDELRKERSELAGELKKAKEKAVAFDDAKAYMDALSRMTVLTRTRADYEKTIIRLTPEQKTVLAQIHLDSDFLVKGSAGTGKTLVLLKAIERAKAGGDEAGLGMEELKGSVTLLTYTTTLVKYDQYLSSLLDDGSSGGRVSTADSFLHNRLRELNPLLSVEYHLPEELGAQFPAAGLTPRELAGEIESFLWGNDISYEEYVVEGIDRRGMKRPLVKEQRMAVWSSAEAMLAAMEERKIYTRNSAALLLARAIASGEAQKVTRTDFIFIDEAQDLPAAVLKAIKACSNRSVILAGDADQSIYQPGFSFKRAGINISGRTRILRMNFRNTVQLHDVAERYRRCGPGVDDENQPEAFRDGPEPELFEGVDTNEMLGLLVDRIALFIETLGYAPENLCVIVPGDDDMGTVRSHLSSQGLEVSDIRDKGFDFASSGAVRITTMHSAKGLDFPVVLLFLRHFFIPKPSLDAAASDRLERNLIYVAMTRAMDHLNVFTRENAENPAIRDLAACFKKSS